MDKKMNNAEYITEIIENFQPLINKVLVNVSHNDKNDLDQEIKIKIIEKVPTLIEKDDIPGFFEFLSKKRY